MAPFRTAFNGYAVKFSPFEEGRIAVATAQNFGIIGNGRQYVLQVGSLLHGPHSNTTDAHVVAYTLFVILQMTPNGLVEVTEFDTKDGIYDCAWSEVGQTTTPDFTDI